MELLGYVRRILKWWWLILLGTGIAAGASFVATSRQLQIYQTTATLLVGQVFREANPTGQDFYTIEQLAGSYAQIAVRQPILQAAIDSLGLEMDWQQLKSWVYAAPIPRTQLLAITVKDTSPERAAALANEIAYQLILQSPSSPENKARQERSEFVRSQLDDLETRIKAAKTRIQELEAELRTALSAREIQEAQNEISSLEDLINTWQANYTNLLNFLQGGDNPNYLTVIEPAPVPTVPVSPNMLMNVLLAAAVGFTLAAGGALVLEYIDDTIKSAEDLSQHLDLTTLGSISRMNGKGYKGKLIVSHSPFSPISEAYRLIRTNIQFAALDRPIKSIAVTSAGPGEGKSITTSNLAVILAQAGLKTILVDADLRIPTLHKIFQVPNSGGLTDLLLAAELEIDGYLRDVGIENLELITSGALPPNASEILGSARMAQLIQRLEAMADVIVFDTPPTLPVTDTAVLSQRVHGVVLVVEAGRTRRDAARQAVARLRRGGANVVGCVLNRASTQGQDYYAYYTRSSARNLPEPLRGGKRRYWWQRLLSPK